MTAALRITTQPWHARVERDAISVALVVHSDYQQAHAGRLAWEHAREAQVAVSDYAAALTRELAPLGIEIDVPIGPGCTGSERYTLRYQAESLASGGSKILHGLEIGREPHWPKPYWIGCEGSGRYVSGVALDDVEAAAWRLLVRTRMVPPRDPMEPLVRRFGEIRDATAGR